MACRVRGPIDKLSANFRVFQGLRQEPDLPGTLCLRIADQEFPLALLGLGIQDDDFHLAPAGEVAMRRA